MACVQLTPLTSVAAASTSEQAPTFLYLAKPCVPVPPASCATAAANDVPPRIVAFNGGNVPNVRGPANEGKCKSRMREPPGTCGGVEAARTASAKLASTIASSGIDDGRL